MFPGPCRSAVTVDEETSSIGGFGKAGLDFLPSAGGSAVGGLLPPCWLESGISVKVTDLFWSPCAVDTHACMRKYKAGNTLGKEWMQGWDGTGKGCKTDMQSALWG